ncbi:hypothetical protein TWF481_006664 [Arthrobotrys musiformis]|uniref:Nucleoside phosphorylase domain-containing protein n=1 Tax=Arthrobotrys musiformis TaxID=47236 RepID=A0AAV9WA69_9PEZI
MSTRECPRPEEINVAIICALALEFDAVNLAFDESWDQSAQDRRYKVGYICEHKVVLALLSNMGKANAAGKASTVTRHDYPNIKLAFLAGICGGVPRAGNIEKEILLGDVVISDGILQWDFGKDYPGGHSTGENWEGGAKHPDGFIRDQLSNLKTVDGRDKVQEKMVEHLKDIQIKVAEGHPDRSGKYKYLGAVNDVLFDPGHRHKHGPTCKTCNDGQDSACKVALDSSCKDLKCADGENPVSRERLKGIQKREDENAHRPSIHIGLVGSGDTVIKSGKRRDELAKSKKIIAFEMEGAGIAALIQCIVVKGVSDYADSHKNKNWQDFAAATAASALKAMLEYLPLYKRTRTTDGFLIVGAVTSESPAPIHGQDLERTQRMNAVQRQLPGLVQRMSAELAGNLQWAPYLKAAPAAICVMASCLVSGSSPGAGSIEVNIRLAGPGTKEIATERSEFLGTSLDECCELGKTAFTQAERGMRKLQNLADFVTGVSGPLAQIVLLLNDSQPDFSSLTEWMNDLSEAAATCKSEATLMQTEFDALLEFIKALQRATIEALHKKNKQKEDVKKAAAKDAEKASNDEYARQLQLAETQKAALEREWEEAKSNLQAAQEKMTRVLKENPCEEIQAQISGINSELLTIAKSGSSWWFKKIFKKIAGRKEQETHTQNLQNQLKELQAKRDEYINHDQTCVIEEFGVCQEKVAEAEEKFRESQDNYTALLQNQPRSAKAFEDACNDLAKLSDATLDLKTIDDILERSIRALKDLNQYIKKMSDFFVEVSGYVEDTMARHLRHFNKQTSIGNFQKQVISRTREQNNEHKASAIMTALNLHGRFTLIHRIAGVYIGVSQTYIMPGINKMDGLTYINEEEYKKKMALFKEWGEKAVDEIGRLAAGENALAEIGNAVVDNVVSLAQEKLGIEGSAFVQARLISYPDLGEARRNIEIF